MILAASLSLFFCALAAQQDIYPGETKVLPLNLALSQSADHSVSAVNDLGDCYTVWNSPQKGNSEECAAEGAYAKYVATPSPHWVIAGQSDILGHPDADLWPGQVTTGTQTHYLETCLKPSVTAIGSNFLVAWPRINLNASGQSRPAYLECVLIEPTPTGYVVHRPAGTTHQGYLFPDGVGGTYQFQAGTSGETISLTRRRFPGYPGSPATGIAALVNVHQKPPLTGDSNEYVLHGWRVEFTPSTTPTIQRLQNPLATEPNSILLNTFYVDETTANVESGRVPPFVLETKHLGNANLGGLLITHETYDTSTEPFQGNLQAHWLDFSSATQVTELTSALYYSVPTNEHRRRSNLATDYAFPNDQRYGFAWQTQDPTGQFTKAHLALITLSIGPPASISFLDRNFPNPGTNPMVQDARAVFGSGLDHLMYVNYIESTVDPPFDVTIWDHRSTGAQPYELPQYCLVGCTTNDRRPSYAQFGDYLAVTYDATAGSGSTRYPFLHILDL